MPQTTAQRKQTSRSKPQFKQPARVKTLGQTLKGFRSKLPYPKEGSWSVTDLEAFHTQLKKPKSIYDRLPASLRPFGWATPAPGFSKVPLPWRVERADRAEQLVKRLFPHYEDIYTDTFGVGTHKGHLVIDVGLRDNRDEQAHAIRMGNVAKLLAREGFKVVFDPRSDDWVHLVDDLPKNVLRERTHFYPDGK